MLAEGGVCLVGNISHFKKDMKDKLQQSTSPSLSLPPSPSLPLPLSLSPSPSLHLSYKYCGLMSSNPPQQCSRRDRSPSPSQSDWGWRRHSSCRGGYVAHSGPVLTSSKGAEHSTRQT